MNWINDYWMYSPIVFLCIAVTILVFSNRLLQKTCEKYDALCGKQSEMIMELMSDWVKECTKNVSIPYAEEVKTIYDEKWRPTNVRGFWYKGLPGGGVIVRTLEQIKEDNENEMEHRRKESGQTQSQKNPPFSSSPG